MTSNTFAALVFWPSPRRFINRGEHMWPSPAPNHAAVIVSVVITCESRADCVATPIHFAHTADTDLRHDSIVRDDLADERRGVRHFAHILGRVESEVNERRLERCAADMKVYDLLRAIGVDSSS